jgi:hypothetical protein
MLPQKSGRSVGRSEPPKSHEKSRCSETIVPSRSLNERIWRMPVSAAKPFKGRSVCKGSDPGSSALVFCDILWLTSACLSC